MRFKKGDRVEMTDRAVKLGLHTPDAHLGPSRTGEVVGFGRDPGTIRVLRDNRKTPETYAAEAWKKDNRIGPVAKAVGGDPVPRLLYAVPRLFRFDKHLAFGPEGYRLPVRFDGNAAGFVIVFDSREKFDAEFPDLAPIILEVEGKP